MLGTKLYKNNTDDMARYTDCAIACNKAGNITIIDQGEYYEVMPFPGPPMEELKKFKLDEVNAWTARKITGGFVCFCYNNEPVLYDTDQDTQITMGKARANCKSEKFALNFPQGMPCRGYVKVGDDENGNPVFDTDKTILFFTPEQIIAWDEDFSLFLSKCKGEGWAKQAEVEMATTVEELEAIELP